MKVMQAILFIVLLVAQTIMAPGNSTAQGAFSLALPGTVQFNGPARPIGIYTYQQASFVADPPFTLATQMSPQQYGAFVLVNTVSHTSQLGSYQASGEWSINSPSSSTLSPYLRYLCLPGTTFAKGYSYLSNPNLSPLPFNASMLCVNGTTGVTQRIFMNCPFPQGYGSPTGNCQFLGAYTE